MQRFWKILMVLFLGVTLAGCAASKKKGGTVEVEDATIGGRSEEHTLNSSHITISYAVFCLKKKKDKNKKTTKKTKKHTHTNQDTRITNLK